MTAIALTRGAVSLVDPQDVDRVSGYRWFLYVGVKDDRYAATSIRKGKKNTTIRMHRLILNAAPGQEVDHINGDGLDNRRENLRFCTRSQNMANIDYRSSRKGSRYKGVGWAAMWGKWRARICLNRRDHHLGYFHDERDAARAYNEAAKAAWGSFARLNQVE